MRGARATGRARPIRARAASDRRRVSAPRGRRADPASLPDPSSMSTSPAVACGTNTCSSPSRVAGRARGEPGAFAGDVVDALAAPRGDLEDFTFHAKRFFPQPGASVRHRVPRMAKDRPEDPRPRICTLAAVRGTQVVSGPGRGCVYVPRVRELVWTTSHARTVTSRRADGRGGDPPPPVGRRG